MLETKIIEHMKEAMKGGNKVALSVLRLAVSELKNKKIEDRVKELSDEKVISVLQKMLKRYKESIEQFRKGNRQDLVEKETTEMKVIEQFLPEQMSADEMDKLVKDTIGETGASSIRDMGKVMALISSRAGGRVDGRTVSELVKNKLSN
jgi:hypothetical protein